MEKQTPKWISEARKMISGCDNRVKHYWDNLTEQERRDLCFLSQLKSRHVQCAWDELTGAEKIALWQGVLKIRKLHKQTSFLILEDFTGVVVCSVSRRVDEPQIPNSMH